MRGVFLPLAARFFDDFVSGVLNMSTAGWKSGLEPYAPAAPTYGYDAR